MFDNLTKEDCDRINNANLDIGYHNHDTDDKMDFVNLLSVKLKIQLIEDIENNQIPNMSTEEDKHNMK